MTRLNKIKLPLLDLLLTPFVFWAALLLKRIRRIGVHRLPRSRGVLIRVGVFPIRNQYYEPLFDARHLTKPLSDDRDLPGVDWNVQGQLELVASFRSAQELKLAEDRGPWPPFDISNGFFEAGDAEFLYNLIRLLKPTRIFEIGSGSSTLMAARAVRRNRAEDATYKCKHLCIEPYETPWLESAGFTVVREKVEKLDKSLFAELGRNDLLFIDSSHVIRPQGDVLFEYLELLPTLAPGVVVHVHDIFSPRDYPDAWIKDEVRLWNEQYLLEAFLSGNRDWRIIGALNYLKHHHYDRLAAVSVFLGPGHEPGSFYMQRVG
jgi:hypothetical protein